MPRVDYHEINRQFRASNYDLNVLLGDLHEAVSKSTLPAGFVALAVCAFAQRIMDDTADPLLDSLEADGLIQDTVSEIADALMVETH